MDRLIVVDVGHGSCTILQSAGEVMVVDAPGGSSLRDFLASEAIGSVEVALVSHCHVDHTEGVFAMVANPDIGVGRVYVNPEHRRGADGLPTRFERRMEAALRVGRRAGTKILTAATSDAVDDESLGSLRFSVLWPDGVTAASGVGAPAEGGTRSVNALSVVVRVLSEAGVNVILPGDIDALGIGEMLGEGISLDCDLLVAPHHGGLLGTTAQTESGYSLLHESAAPSEVIVSIGRSQASNPRDELILQALKNGSTIRCTQLSQRCVPDGELGFRSVSSVWSQGNADEACCFGSIVVDLATGEILGAAEHSARVGTIGSAVCRS